MHVEGRGHLCETISVSHHMGSRDQNPLISLIGKHLCLLSYLSVPKINTLIGKHSGPKNELGVKHTLNTHKAPSSSLSTEKTKQQTNKQTKIFSPNYTRQPEASPGSSETSSTRGNCILENCSLLGCLPLPDLHMEQHALLTHEVL